MNIKETKVNGQTTIKTIMYEQTIVKKKQTIIPNNKTTLKNIIEWPNYSKSIKNEQTPVKIIILYVPTTVKK